MKFDKLNDDIIKVTGDHIAGIKAIADVLKDFIYCRDQLFKYSGYKPGDRAMLRNKILEAPESDDPSFHFCVKNKQIVPGDYVNIKDIRHEEGEFKYIFTLENDVVAPKDKQFFIREQYLFS